MSLLEIDRLKLSLSGVEKELELDFNLDPGTNCAFYSRDKLLLSSLFDILAGFNTSFSGRVFLAGRSIGGLSLAERGITAFGVDCGLYDHLTAAGNLAVPAGEKQGSDLPTRGLVEKTLWEFGLDAMAGYYPEELDDRNRILLSLAKATIADPVLTVGNLLDGMPSGFQGFNFASDIRRHIERLALTAILITNDPFTALNIGKEIVIAGKPGVIQRGTAKELVTSPEHLETARAFAIPGLNIFSGTVTEEQPFLFIESNQGFFSTPGRMRDYFRQRVGDNHMMAVRPESVELLHPDEKLSREKNLISVKRIDNIGLGLLTYFDFGDSEWCAFLPADKAVYPGMKLTVHVPEDAWFFPDENGKIMLDL